MLLTTARPTSGDISENKRHIEYKGSTQKKKINRPALLKTKTCQRNYIYKGQYFKQLINPRTNSWKLSQQRFPAGKKLIGASNVPEE